MKDGAPAFPSFLRSPQDPFLQRLYAPRTKWLIITDLSGTPLAALDAHRFLLDALLADHAPDPLEYMHQPIIAKDRRMPLGRLIGQFKVRARNDQDDVIDDDVILLWSGQKRIVTGADLLGRLLRGIAQRRAS
jgi:hypothetical protein